MTPMLCFNAPSNRSTFWKLNTIFDGILYAFAHKGRMDSLVDIETVTAWTIEKRWYGLRQRRWNNLCSKDSRPALKPTQFSMHWIPGVLRTPEVKRPENGACHSPHKVPWQNDWTIRLYAFTASKATILPCTYLNGGMVPLVEAQHCRPEGYGLDSRLSHWNISLEQFFRSECGPGVDSTPNRNE